MNRRILGLALPNIITNITVPLLGMVDMAIVGRLSPDHIGAISIGASLFNLIYWNFGFLRMGTSGFTAQAYGAGRMTEAVGVLVRAVAIALGIALTLIVLQWPISLLVPVVFNGSAHTLQLALTYFFVRIWAAPATLGLYAIKGWFIGMQNSRLPMWIAIALNIVNIGCSLLFVVGLGWDIAGVALGTVVAQYSGLALGLFFLRRELRRLGRTHGSLGLDRTSLRATLRWPQMKAFFKVNADIFLRTLCLSAVFTYLTSASGHISNEVLAINALLLQFFHLFSYIMDGFAYAGESLVGRYIGAREPRNLRQCVRLLMGWGLVLTLLFSIGYATSSQWLLRLFTDDPSLIAATAPYLVWVLAIPVCGFSAFLFDGIYIGATASRTMRDAMFVATAAFFLLYLGGRALLPSLSEQGMNHLLWASFMLYLLLRGMLLLLPVRRKVYALAEQPKPSL